ncbi:hypothetical protein MNEG_14820, partial [Monoraphidium neglectum]
MAATAVCSLDVAGASLALHHGNAWTTPSEPAHLLSLFQVRGPAAQQCSAAQLPPGQVKGYDPDRTLAQAEPSTNNVGLINDEDSSLFQPVVHTTTGQAVGPSSMADPGRMAYPPPMPPMMPP